MIEPFECMSIRCVDGANLEILDQRLIPLEEKWLPSKSIEDMCELILCLAVRGAPAIGIAASASLALCAESIAAAHPSDRTAAISGIQEAADRLRSSRPTAVNLMVCMDAMMAAAAKSAGDSTASIVPALAAECKRLREEDIAMCDSMATLGAALVKPGEKILTICNTGALATAGVGTAIGVIRKCHERAVGDSAKDVFVHVLETRPLLQGGRLTAWEMHRLGVPHALSVDSCAGTLMRSGRVDRVLVGADRIAANGDFANKIGTYSLAVMARHHGIPFHVVAPRSTIDPECASGDGIPIEQRCPSEARGVKGAFGECRWAPEESPVFNPAFDVTPADLVTSWIFDGAVLTGAHVADGWVTKLASGEQFPSN